MPSPKRVAIDLRMVGSVPHGIARYSLALWNGLPERSDLRYLALCRREGLALISPKRSGDQIRLTRSRFISPLEQFELPAVLWRSGVDLLHATSFAAPLAWRGPLVMTIHDLTHLRLPELHGPGRLQYYRWFVAPAARRAAAVLTESEFEKGEIVRRLGVAPGRVYAAPLSIELGAALTQEAPKMNGGSPGPVPVLLYVGNGKPHKNVEILVRALPMLRQPARLLLVGEGLDRFAGTSIEIRPPVDDRTLLGLYRQATLFLFPSRSEGFGLPPLEAASQGTPVLLGEAPVLREIWRGTAPLLPLDDPTAWAAEIDRLLGDRQARLTLAETCRGLAARYLSWEPLLTLAESAYRRGLAAT